MACLLWPVAVLHGWLVRLRQMLYRTGFLASERFAVPLIVVGNVVAGGAGKTPLVIALVRHLQGQGLQAGVVSRGYGRAERQVQQVLPQSSAAESGDEPLLTCRATGVPVFVANRRADAVRALLAAYPATQAVVCDDGLQHYALQRDIDIVVFDDQGIGNGWLLPAGPLREPWPARHHRSPDLVLHTGMRPAFEGFTSTRQLAAHAYAADGSRHLLAGLRGMPIAAVAGIANPEAFFTMLRDCGVALAETRAFPDHHAFAPHDLSQLQSKVVLCTEKDAVKLFGLTKLIQTGQPLLLAVPLEFTPEVALFAALDAKLAPLLALSLEATQPK